MPTIKLLPSSVIAQIAAGEVIQRPADILKELIENALDAQTTTIDISLEDAGLTQIQITDNGHGIPKSDLALALTPHATSKLTHLKDFNHLATFGFRGEALASIAQVSHITLQSRSADQESGYQISHPKDKPHPIGMPQGTRITITKLFNQIPVRQEFLHRSKSQLRQITQLVTAYALANPQITFSLEHNHRQLMQLPSQTQIQRTENILGTNLYSQLIPIQHTAEDKNKLHISGFISQPSLWTKIPNKQYLFVNNRPITHRKLQSFLRHTTQQLHANKFHPIYSIHLTVEPQTIDVNIHPQKHTVDFFQFDQIKQTLTQAIQPLLVQRPLTYTSISDLSYQVQDQNGQYHTHQFRQGLGEQYHQSTDQTPQLTGKIQQLSNLYLLAPTSNGLLLIDQHALHERILYDQLHHIYQTNKSHLLKNKSSINLVFDLDIDQTLLLQQHLQDLSKLGFDIEPFGEHSFKLNQVPQLFSDHNLYQLIIDTLYQIEHDDDLQIDSQTDALIASMACRMAIKAGDYVKPSKRKQLLKELLSAKHTGTCPHGRPVSIRITLNELNKLFKRT